MREHELQREYETVMGRLHERTATIKERKRVLLDDLPELSAEATSPDGVATVSVNADGLLTSLRLGDSVTSLSPGEIADLVLRTYSAAQSDIARRAGDLLAPSLGEAGYVAAQFRRREDFEPDYATADRPDSRPAHAADDDDLEFDGPFNERR